MGKDFQIPAAGQPTKRELITPRKELLKSKAKLIIGAGALALIKPKFYKLAIPTVEKSKAKEFAVNSTEIANADSQRAEFAENGGKFGLPVFDSLTFSGSGSKEDALTYTTFEGETITLQPLRMEIVLLTVTMVKNIVKTPISGRNGTVKEYVSNGDFKIEAKGMFIGDYTDVEDTVNKKHLIDFCDANVSINCSSGYLQDFGINSLVIDKYIINQVEGKRNQTMFELTCFSDTPFEIQSTIDGTTV